MPRGMWTGNISFGLVTVPVQVVSAENAAEGLDFDMIDKRDHAHIGYKKINKKTGKEIDSKDIVKGLKLDSGKYAIFEQGELNKLRVKGSKSIDIEQFVEMTEVDPSFFKKTYYLVPGKNGEKVYVLLRETLRNTKKYGVGMIVLHTKQQLGLIGVSGPAMTLHIIHYDKEIKDPKKEYDLPAEGTKSVKINPKELAMAERLVDELTDKFKPENFKDTYIEQVKAAVKKKSKVSADDTEIEQPEEEEGNLSKVLDLMPLLEKSLKTKSKSTKTSASHSKSSGKKSARG